MDARRRWPGWSSSSSTSHRQAAGLDYRITQAFADCVRARPHSFVVGGFALVIGVQLISLGLLATQTKRYFEEMFHLGTGSPFASTASSTAMVVVPCHRSQTSIAMSR